MRAPAHASPHNRKLLLVQHILFQILLNSNANLLLCATNINSILFVERGSVCFVVRLRSSKIHIDIERNMVGKQRCTYLWTQTL